MARGSREGDVEGDQLHRRRKACNHRVVSFVHGQGAKANGGTDGGAHGESCGALMMRACRSLSHLLGESTPTGAACQRPQPCLRRGQRSGRGVTLLCQIPVGGRRVVLHRQPRRPAEGLKGETERNLRVVGGVPAGLWVGCNMGLFYAGICARITYERRARHQPERVRAQDAGCRRPSPDHWRRRHWQRRQLREGWEQQGRWRRRQGQLLLRQCVQ